MVYQLALTIDLFRPYGCGWRFLVKVTSVESQLIGVLLATAREITSEYASLEGERPWKEGDEVIIIPPRHKNTLKNLIKILQSIPDKEKAIRFYGKFPRWIRKTKKWNVIEYTGWPTDYYFRRRN